MNKSIILIFWALVINFLFILSLLFIPAARKPFQGSMSFLIPFIIFFLLGLVLTILVFKSKARSKLKKFLLLTGISSAGMFVSIFLHNVIYGVFIYLFGIDIWERIGTGDEPVFFFIALFFCPIGILIGITGSMIMIIKEQKRNN